MSTLAIVNQFNRLALNNKSIIQKALSSAAGVGEALIPQNLEKQITDTVIRLSPELALLTPKPIAGKTHDFNRLVTRPAPAGAMGENATTPVTNSKTARDTLRLKVVRRKGKVTNFLNDASREFIDVAAFEMENHLQAHVLDLIAYSLYGNEDSNDFEWDGLDKLIATNRIDYLGAKPTTLAVLDQMIDKSNRKGGARHRRAFGMSPEMLSRFSAILSNVRLNQGLTGGLSQVDVNGGWRLNAYRDIPIIETTSTSPIETMRPTITLAQVASGGSLSDGVYKVQVAPITVNGEQLASAEQSITLTGGGSAQKITIALSDIHKDVDGNINVFSYKIYVALTTPGAEVLVKWVPAYIYDAEGSPVSYNGVTAPNIISVTTLTPGADVPSHMQADKPLAGTIGASFDEIIYLWDLDPIQGLGKMPYTNTAGDQFNGLVTTKPLAETDDFIQFLVKSYTALTPSFEATSCWVRRIRVA